MDCENYLPDCSVGIDSAIVVFDNILLIVEVLTLCKVGKVSIWIDTRVEWNMRCIWGIMVGCKVSVSKVDS